MDKDWVKNIVKPFSNPATDVVAGYYAGIPKTVFEKSLIPYVLVMPDKVNPETFLPASRSMAFKKSIWEKAGGFPEKFSNNEDYVFAQRLKKINANIIFENKAVVNWIPRNNLRDAFGMFFRFSLGDGESGILRDKVILLFARYMLVFYFILLTFIERSKSPLYLLGIGFVAYIIWSINKNYKYVNDRRAFYYLPALQFTSDIAVISGSTVGFIKAIRFDKVLGSIKKNKGTVLVIGMYIAAMLTVINRGIPNNSHPFDYFMDEWHQAQAVRSVFTQGTPNVPGSANGSMFHFLLSGLLLIPFMLTGMVNPFAIKSSVASFDMQQRLFEALRLNTLFFGVMSVILVVYIAKKYFRLNPFLISFIFVVNPIWIMLSNYFKYDIALIFWIILAFIFMLRYSVKPSLKNYILAAFVSGLAFSVKLSALPLLAILLTSYVIFAKKIKNNLKQLMAGIFVFLFTFLIFGIPDLLLGKGNIGEYLYDNLIRAPGYVSNYILGTNYINYLFFKGAPTVFGNLLFYLSNVSCLFTIGYLIKSKLKGEMDKRYLLLIISLLFFIISLLILKIEARGNRLLVLLPFMVLFCGIFIEKILKTTNNLKKVIASVLIILCLFQFIETFSWFNLKLKTDLRQSSSDWIRDNIPSKSIIGIENIPIYQFLPDILLKDYYQGDRHISKSVYDYSVINAPVTKLPDFVVVTNEEVAEDYTVSSPKKDLLNILGKEYYQKIYNQELNLDKLGLFRSKLDYYMSGLVQEPLSISVYKKQNTILSKINK